MERERQQERELEWHAFGGTSRQKGSGRPHADTRTLTSPLSFPFLSASSLISFFLAFSLSSSLFLCVCVCVCVCVCSHVRFYLSSLPLFLSSPRDTPHLFLSISSLFSTHLSLAAPSASTRPFYFRFSLSLSLSVQVICVSTHPLYIQPRRHQQTWSPHRTARSWRRRRYSARVKRRTR
jgi:hypothetical protein